MINKPSDMHSSNAETYLNLAKTYHALGDAENALIAAQNAHIIYASLYEKDHPKVICSGEELRSAQRTLLIVNKTSEYKKALEDNLKKYGENNLEVAASYSNLGICLKHHGKNQEAIAYYKKAIEIMLALGQKDNSNIAGIYDRLAMIYYKNLHNDETAITYLEKAAAIYQKLNQKEDAADVALGLKKLKTRISMKSNLTKYSGTLFKSAETSQQVVTEVPTPRI